MCGEERPMTVDLTTTNVLLGILATVSVLEALVVVAFFVAGFLMLRRLMTMIEGVEQRQVVPMAMRMNAILDDVKGVTGCAKNAADHVERYAGWWRMFRGA
jgi:hypothetical protein